MFYDDPQDPLFKAAKYVDQATATDNNFFDLAVLLGTDTFNEPTIGGGEPIEYPNMPFQVPEMAPLKVKVMPMELQERLKQLQCSCQMGVFTEIGRAWLSIDNELYLWTYEDGTDIAYYDGLGEVVLAAALVHPKPNIFQSHISHLLCVATPIEVVILGITFAASSDANAGIATSFNDLQILPEPLYAVATDNVHMTSIVSISSGRIFMAGKDGCLYELEYQGDFGWFGRRSCRKINHSTSFSSYILPSFMTSYFSEEDALVQLCCDESRKLVFARSQKGNIQVFYLGKDGKQFNRIACANNEKTLKKISKNFDTTRLGSIVHISPIPAYDSERVHLVAVMSSGARLYFTTRGYSDTPLHPAAPPNCLTLLHLRTPPNFAGQSSPHRFPRSTAFPVVHDVHSAACSRGTYLFTSSNLNEDGDTLWTLSSDSFPFTSMLSESCELTQMAGRVWSIEEIQTQSDQLIEVLHNPATPTQQPLGSHDAILQWTASPPSFVVPDPPAVVTQHYTANRKFAIVSSVGVCIALKLSPSEQLQQLLLKHSVDSEPIRSYFRLLKEQAMTNCLALMCSKSSSHLQVNSLATKAYNAYKWGQVISNFGYSLTQEQTSTPMPSQISRHLHFQQEPLQVPFVDFNNTSLNHRSLYLYLARLLRPIWSQPITHRIPDSQTGGTTLASRLTSSQLTLVLQKCLDFKVLLHNNPSILSHMPASTSATIPGVSTILPDSFSVSRNVTSGGALDVQTDEVASLRNIETLLDASCQCLSMWKILADHQLHILIMKLKQEEQQLLASIDFSQLLLLHRGLCKQLISTLVDFYIDDNAATDVVSNKLRDSCPLLYSSQDQAQTKGNECLKLAKTTLSPMEKKKLIQTAVQQYKITISSATPTQLQQLGGQSQVGDLPSMCSRLASVGAFSGLVDLVLTAASKRDPNNVALHYYLRSKPQEDQDGAKFYVIRCDCYKSIMEALDHLVTLCSQGEQLKPSEGFGKLIGVVAKFFSAGPADDKRVPPLGNGCVVAPDEADKQVEEMVDMIMKSDDQMAHYALFDWVNSRGLLEKLLDLPSPHLEQYLKQESGVDSLQQQQQNQPPMQPQQLMKQKVMLDLLANYYVKEKKFSLAAKILDQLAMKPGPHMSLKERLNYMSRAGLCLQSCVSRTDGEFMHQVQDKVEVILLQLEVLKNMQKCTARPQHMIDEAAHLLDTQLYDISELYSHFAIPYELSVCKLAILHISGLRDANLIDSVWREVIEKEVEASTNQEPMQRMELLSACIVDLGKIYSKTENYFPLAFLVKHLEQLSVRCGFSVFDLTFVARSFLEIGVAVRQLHDVYEKLFRQKDAFWKNNKRQYHLVEVDIFIIGQFLEQIQANKFVPADKRQVLSRCLDGVCFYLVELQSDYTADAQLIGKLKEVQIKMERLER